MRNIAIPFTLAILLGASAASGFEPVERFDLDQSRPQTLEGPCSEDWQRLHFWYSDVKMSCALFREQILGCADMYGSGWLFGRSRAFCMSMVALGSDVPKRYGYAWWDKKAVHFDEVFSRQDIERVLQMLRVLHGRSPLEENPFGMEKELSKWRARLIKKGGNPRTNANRDAVRWGARRTRVDP